MWLERASGGGAGGSEDGEIWSPRWSEGGWGTIMRKTDSDPSPPL